MEKFGVFNLLSSLLGITGNPSEGNKQTPDSDKSGVGLGDLLFSVLGKNGNALTDALKKSFNSGNEKGGVKPAAEKPSSPVAPIKNPMLETIKRHDQTVKRLKG